MKIFVPPSGYTWVSESIYVTLPLLIETGSYWIQRDLTQGPRSRTGNRSRFRSVVSLTRFLHRIIWFYVPQRRQSSLLNLVL